MQVERKTDELVPCLCGYKPDHVSIGYGPEPYNVFCPECKKQTGAGQTKYHVTGAMANEIDYWNKHVSQMTMEELQEELKSFQMEKKAADPEYITYKYFWYKDHKPKFVKSTMR